MLKPYQKVVGYSPNKYLFKKHSHLQRYYFLRRLRVLFLSKKFNLIVRKLFQLYSEIKMLKPCQKVVDFFSN